MASSSIKLVLILAICAALLPGCEKIEALEPHMGTMFRIVVCRSDTDADSDAVQKAIRAAFERIADLDDKLSDYKPDSELNRVGRDAVGKPLPVSEDLYTILKKSQSIADSSGGAFDVTVGPVVRVWRIARKNKQPPAQKDVAGALSRTGYMKMHVADHAVLLDLPGMQLDLGAIAKGYAADEALGVLAKQGFSSALVAASGDIAIGNAPPGKGGWEIGIESLNSSNELFTRTVLLHNAAVSTSGDSEQYFETASARYSHIVDPGTGIALTHRISVSVVAHYAIDSDALATAASVVTARHGANAALAFIERLGGKGIIVTKADGKFTQRSSAP